MEHSFQSIVCPSCGNDTLHHQSVDVWACDAEDSKQMHVVNVRPTGAGIFDDCFVGESPAVNTLKLPRALVTGRRGSIEIHFACESCHARPVLQIYQHKGTSQMRISASAWSVGE